MSDLSPDLRIFPLISHSRPAWTQRNKTSLGKHASEFKIHRKISKKQFLNILDKPPFSQHSKTLPSNNLKTDSSAIIWSVYHWKLNLSCNCNHIHSCKKATAYIISAAQTILRPSKHSEPFQGLECASDHVTRAKGLSLNLSSDSPFVQP